MGMTKAGFFVDHDVFIEDDFEEVMFRWDSKKRKYIEKSLEKKPKPKVAMIASNFAMLFSMGLR